MKDPKISIVCPLYGGRDCLEALVDCVVQTFQESDIDWEFILVDDRGPDEPWPLVERFAALNSRIRGIRLARNHGQHLAIWAGLEVARGEWVAVIDCDLQDNPALIPLLYKNARDSDVDALVVRRGGWSDNRIRRFASRAFFRIIRLMTGIEIENSGNFGIYSRRMVDTLLLYREQELFLPFMVSLTGLRVDYIEAQRDARYSGVSSYSIFRLLKLAGSIIVRFSDRPLQISVIAGLAFSGLATLVSVVIFFLWAFRAVNVPGWTSTMLSMWFLSGLILAVLGVHGIYLGRVFSEVKGRPRILIERTTFNEKSP